MAEAAHPAVAEPSLARKIGAGAIVAALVITVWAVIEWRSGQPPPPEQAGVGQQ